VFTQGGSPPHRLSIAGQVDHGGHGLVHLPLADGRVMTVHALGEVASFDARVQNAHRVACIWPVVWIFRGKPGHLGALDLALKCPTSRNPTSFPRWSLMDDSIEER
jgi:hypothetical protein